MIAEGAGDGGEGVRRAPDLLRHERHLDREQGHLPDDPRPGREAAARPQLPQVGPPWGRAVGRAPRLPQLLGQPHLRHLRAGTEEDHPRGDGGAPGRRGPDPHLVHLRRLPLRPEADHRGGARAGHPRHHRRGLVRLRPLPPRLPADRDRGGRRLRDAVDAQSHERLLAGEHDSRQRPGVQRAPLPRELQHAHVDVAAVRDDREPRRGAKTDGDGGLQAPLAHARARAGAAQPDQLHRRLPRARARGAPARRGEARRHPPRPDQGDGGHLDLRLHGRGPAARALHPLQHPGREVDLQHADRCCSRSAARAARCRGSTTR